MFMNKSILWLACSLSALQASTQSTESDIYGDQVPRPCIVNDIRYTTPALQGIRRNHLNIGDVERIVKQSDDKFGGIHSGHIYLLLRRCEGGASKEVTSVWTE